MTNNNYMVFDTDFYNTMQKHFKNDLNGDEFLFNWYCEVRNKLIKEIDKKNSIKLKNKTK